jgi:hypothetical protein
MTTRQQVLRLAMENPQWLRALEVACDVATENQAWQQFAGTYVIQRLLGEDGLELPNLTPLVGYGLLVRVGSARRGKRAYYWMPDVEGVREALAEADKATLRWTAKGTARADGFKASYNPCGSTTPGGQVKWDVYSDDAKSTLVEEGYAANLAAAKEKCREVIARAMGSAG